MLATCFFQSIYSHLVHTKSSTLYRNNRTSRLASYFRFDVVYVWVVLYGVSVPETVLV